MRSLRALELEIEEGLTREMADRIALLYEIREKIETYFRLKFKIASKRLIKKMAMGHISRISNQTSIKPRITRSSKSRKSNLHIRKKKSYNPKYPIQGLNDYPKDEESQTTQMFLVESSSSILEDIEKIPIDNDSSNTNLKE